MMKIAIVQPYFFPYIGYFQLIRAVDSFVIYDDVNFIKRGWINRNRILVNGTAKHITIPCLKASQNKLINEVGVGLDQKNKNKLLKTIDISYHKAPFFERVFPLFERTLSAEVNHIGELAAKSIEDVCKYLDIDTKIIPTSTIFTNRHLKKADRLIDICKILGSLEYINLIGGSDIYTKEYFKERGINISFLKSKDIRYKQFNNEFVPWLSIIDVMMFNSVEAIQHFLNNFELI